MKALLMVAVLALAACGKVGPPLPVGPPDKVIWPHAYPTPHPSP
jgi:predicted small lipoprotein YifL